MTTQTTQRRTALDALVEYVYDRPSELAELVQLRRRGACRGWPMEWFYPKRGASVERARAICEGCPVRAVCLAGCLQRHEGDGIWGGTAEKDRRALHALRRQGMPIPEIVDRVLAGELDDEMMDRRSRGQHRAESRRNRSIREAVAVLAPVVHAMDGGRLVDAISCLAEDPARAMEAAKVLGLIEDQGAPGGRPESRRRGREMPLPSRTAIGSE